MTSPDDEFDDFLRKRRPLFGRPDELEPPLELDRVVLRQAREAIESERPHRIFHTPSWGMPAALAATLVLAFTIILRVGKPEVVKHPEVTVQNVSRQVMPAQAAPPAPASEDMRAASPAEAPAPGAQAEQAEDSGAVVVDLGAVSAKAEANAPRVAERRAAPAATAPKPQYRRDTKSWLAEIERLRAAGETGQAEAELAEYKREHRAYAGSPDR
jgi:hypothetical protein